MTELDLDPGPARGPAADPFGDPSVDPAAGASVGDVPPEPGAGSDGRGGTGRLAVQLALVALLVVVAGLVFANSFRPADLLGPLAVAAVAPALVQLAGHRLRWPATATVGASLLLLVGWLAAWTLGDDGWPVRPLVEVVVDGPARILTASIPAPAEPALLGVPVVLAWIAATAASRAVVGSTSTLLPALPPVVLAVVAALFGSSGLGWAPSVAWALVAGAVVLAALRASWAESTPAAAPAPRLDRADADPDAEPRPGWAALRRQVLVVLPLLVALPLVAGLVVPALPGLDDRDPVELRDRFELEPDEPLAVSPLDDLGASYVDDPRTEADERDALVVTVRSDEGIPVTTTSDGARVVHITQAVLDTYDGARWVDDATYEAAGAPLPADQDRPDDVTTTTRRLEVELHRTDGLWLPTVGRASELVLHDGVDAAAVDPASGTLLAREDRAAEGARYDLVTTVTELPPPDRRRPTPGLPPSGRSSVDIGTGATDLAAQLERLDEVARAATGDLGFADQLLALEALFRNEVRPEARPALEAVRLGDPDFRFVGPETIEASADVDPDAEEAIGRNVPTGHALERILRFLYTPNEQDQLAQRRGLGTPEQFATAFVLLARSQGIPARVAVGYTVPVGAGEPTAVEARARHADAWPEVYTADLGWVPYAPTPPDLGETIRRADTESTTTTATIAPSTTAAGSATPTTVLTEPGADAGADRDGTLVLVVVLVVLVLMVAAASAPAAGRALRRRRRRRLPPAASVGAAWDDTAEHLVACGVPLEPSMTAGEAGDATGASLGAAAGAATRRLAGLVEAAACGPDAPGPDEARRAWSTAAEVRRNASRVLGLPARSRAALDVASGRRYHRRAESARRDLRRPLGTAPGRDAGRATVDGPDPGAGEPPLGIDLRLPAGDAPTRTDGAEAVGAAPGT